jgi:hypothetical protein
MTASTLLAAVRHRAPRARPPLAAVLVLAACTPAPRRAPVLDAPAVRALASRRPTTLLLVFDPSQCLSCAADMPRWLNLRTTHPRAVSLLMTRTPSAGEAKYFTIARIPVDGVLGDAAGLPRRRPPAGYLFHGGRLVASGPLSEPGVRAAIAREVGS